MMETKRRPFLASIAFGVLGVGSGCLADEYETEGNDDDPIEATAGELVLEPQQLEGEDWEIVSEHDYGDEYGRHFSNGEVAIINNINVYESVANAKSALQREKESYERQDAVHGTHKIGSDGFYYTVMGPTVVVRDANIIGAILLLAGEDELGEDEEDLVFSTAVTMHETWR